MKTGIERLEGARFDVLVVGAGINGASAAQHLAAEGYSVLLADKADIGAGTTSRSSRLLHCGARYFVPGRSMAEFFLQPQKGVIALRLARAAMQMRAQMKRTSGERLRSFNWCYPIYRNGRYKAWQFDLAFRLLGALGPSDVPLGYRRMSRAETLAAPLLEWQYDPEQLTGAATMQEFQYIWPERIAVDAALDARRLGAEVVPYTEVTGLTQTDDGGWRADLRADGDTARIEAGMLVNTAGIWIDQLNARASQTARRKIHGTKGIHIALRLPERCAGWATVNYSTDDEPLFCAPFNDFHYIGPSEVNWSGDPDDIAPTEAEIEQMVWETNRVLPGMGLQRKNVLFSWAGVRPLTYGGPAFPKGNRLRVLHDLADDGMQNAVALTGGVIMTHRSAAQEIVGAVKKRVAPSGPKQDLSYAGRRFPLDRDSPALSNDDPEIRLADLRSVARDELPQTLGDILFRRLPVGYRADMGRTVLRRAAEEVAGPMGWNADEVEAQIAKYLQDTRHLHALPETPPASGRKDIS
ncbi:MAG: FAD-dependent oxidoreductase [Marinovum algicola]|uniref:FAD-dependent oxidoreductase n=1 Tax=Roseobacteraceae TaxID=2854170 RepID=UPI0032EC1FAC